MQSEHTNNQLALPLREPTTVDYLMNVVFNVFLLRPLDPRYIPNSYIPSLLLISLIVTVYFIFLKRDKLYGQDNISILQFYGTTIKKMFLSQASLRSFFVEFFDFTVSMIIRIILEILTVLVQIHCISRLGSVLLKTKDSPAQFAVLATGALFICAIRATEFGLSSTARRIAKWILNGWMIYNFYINYSQYCDSNGNDISNGLVILIVATTFLLLKFMELFHPLVSSTTENSPQNLEADSKEEILEPNQLI